MHGVLCRFSEIIESHNQVVTGPIYVLKIKSSKEFKSKEMLYSIVHKGASNMGLLLFKEIVEDMNTNFCLTQTVNNRNDTTWDQCLTEAGDIKPKGDPLMFIDKVYTFLEIGELAYKHNVLTNKQGLEIIQRRGKQQQEVSPELIPGAMKGAKKPGVTLSELVSEAHDTAAAFRAQYQSLGNPPIPNSSQGLQQLVGTITSDEVFIVPDESNEVTITTTEVDNATVSYDPSAKSSGDQDDCGTGSLTLNDWMARALAAESKVKELENYQNGAIHEIAVLRSKLNSTEILNFGYMAELDKKDQLLRLVNDNIASSVASALSSKLEKLTNFEENVNRILELISPTDDETPNVFDQSLQAVCARADSNCNSIMAGIKATNDMLTSFGMCLGEKNLDIPLTLDFLLGMVSQGDGTPMRNMTDNDRVCF